MPPEVLFIDDGAKWVYIFEIDFDHLLACRGVQGRVG